MSKIFEPSTPIVVKDLKELNLEQILSEAYTAKTIQIEKTEGGTASPAVCSQYFLID